VGLKYQLIKLNAGIKLPSSLSLDVNIDGLPLFNSSKAQLWPILIRLNIVENVPIFPVGVFLGRSKPGDCNEFLGDFCSELDEVVKSGVVVDGRNFSVQLRAVVCDAPARAFISGTPGHTSSHGCAKCTQVAKKINSTLTYSTESGVLLTDADFANRTFPGHHTKKYLAQKCALEKISVCMVTQIS